MAGKSVVASEHHPSAEFLNCTNELVEMPYERLVASDEVECSSSGFDVVVAAQESARQRRNTREKLERLVWMLVSAVIVWFGDGSNNLVHIGIERAKAERCALSTTLRAVKPLLTSSSLKSALAAGPGFS